MSEVTRDPTLKVWLLTEHSGTRIVHSVMGKVITSSLELEYRYSDPYIATRRDNEDLSKSLTRAAGAILQEEAALPRGARIALLEKRAAQDRVLEKICDATIGNRVSCPIRMRLTPQNEATALGGLVRSLPCYLAFGWPEVFPASAPASGCGASPSFTLNLNVADQSNRVSSPVTGSGYIAPPGFDGSPAWFAEGLPEWYSSTRGRVMVRSVASLGSGMWKPSPGRRPIPSLTC